MTMPSADSRTDRAAEAVWNAARAELLGFVRKRVSDEAAAEDITHDVLARAFALRATLRGANKLRPWLYQIARNAIVDHYRANARSASEPLSDQIPQEAPDASEAAERELARCLRPFVDALPPRYRQPVTLADLEGVSQHEVAARLGLSLSGAKSRVQRARKMLADAVLDCCHVEFDRRGAVIDHDCRKSCECS